MSNINGPLPIGEAVTAPLRVIMEAYDALPPRLKALYDLLPVNASPMEFHEMRIVYGEEAAYRMIYDLIDENFPGWNGGVRRRK